MEKTLQKQEPVSIEDFLLPTEELSSEEKLKAEIVGELIERYSNNGKKNIDWGTEFDKFYDMEITELIMLREMYR